MKLKSLTSPVFALCVTLLMAMGTARAQFAHPGLLHTRADLDRMKAKVTAGEQPWKADWDVLVANSHSQLSYTPRPQSVV